jgi:hypothetical protein
MSLILLCPEEPVKHGQWEGDVTSSGTTALDRHVTKKSAVFSESFELADLPVSGWKCGSLRDAVPFSVDLVRGDDGRSPGTDW